MSKQQETTSTTVNDPVGHELAQPKPSIAEKEIALVLEHSSSSHILDLPTQFPANKSKLLIPVLHLIFPPKNNDNNGVKTHALSQASLAIEAGADGLALIRGESMSNDLVNDVALAVRIVYPDLPLTINYMCPLHDALRDIPLYAHLWTDKGVDSTGVHPQVTGSISSRREDWKGVWLCGFFHKGSRRDFSISDEVLQSLTDSVLKISDIPMTSGAGTGTPPEVENVARLQGSIHGRARIGNASGVTNDNVRDLLPYIDLFFVATGIEEDETDPDRRQFYIDAGIPGSRYGWLDPAKVRALADTIHSYNYPTPEIYIPSCDLLQLAHEPAFMRVVENAFLSDSYPSMHLVAPRLYLGSVLAAGALPPAFDSPEARKAAYQKLLACKITHVVCVTGSHEPLYTPFADRGIRYCNELLSDAEADSVASREQFAKFLLHRAIPFIYNALLSSKDACVLIHCQSGMHRSSSILISYMMTQRLLLGAHSRGHRVEDVYLQVRNIRCIAFPVYFRWMISELEPGVMSGLAAYRSLCAKYS